MKIKNICVKCIPLLIIAIFVTSLFGFSGLKLFLGYFFAIFLPTYILLRNIHIEEIERIFFSFFMGLILVPLVIWYINRIIPSLRISIWVTSILLIVIGVYISLNKQKGLNKKSD